MFYRYEAKNEDGEYEGIFNFFDPSQRRYFNRFVKEPKWYEKNPETDSRCWFTEEGYTKYYAIIEELIAESGNLEVRLLTKNTLDNVVCKGRIQCIELVVPEKKSSLEERIIESKGSQQKSSKQCQKKELERI